jgi:hypothetical protein
MGERSAMQRVARVLLTVLMTAFTAVLVSGTPGMAQSGRGEAARNTTDAEPLVRQRVRPRASLRVRPLYPYRRSHSLYPLPYDVEFPGPNAKRECVDAYVTEHRPSGTVIVPRMRCRWVRG